MPSAEQKTKNEVGNESGPTVPNGNARNTRREVGEDSRDDAEDGHCDAEPNTEKPGSDRNWRQIEDEERVFEAGDVVKPANKADQKKTTGYDQASPKHRGQYSLERLNSTRGDEPSNIAFKPVRQTGLQPASFSKFLKL